jgi:hypothetical protein
MHVLTRHSLALRPVLKTSSMLRIPTTVMLAVVVWALVLGLLAWSFSLAMSPATPGESITEISTTITAPQYLTLVLNTTSATIGSRITFNSTGWNPGETLLLTAFNQKSGEYISLWSGEADLHGIGFGVFTVGSKMIGQNGIYMEDPESPFPHTGYTSPTVSLTIAGT